MTKPKKTESDKKPNLLVEALKRKEAKNNILGKDISSKFSPRTNRAERPTKRGGRNGQGKP